MSSSLSVTILQHFLKANCGREEVGNVLAHNAHDIVCYLREDA